MPSETRFKDSLRIGNECHAMRKSGDEYIASVTIQEANE